MLYRWNASLLSIIRQMIFVLTILYIVLVSSQSSRVADICTISSFLEDDLILFLGLKITKRLPQHEVHEHHSQNPPKILLFVPCVFFTQTLIRAEHSERN